MAGDALASGVLRFGASLALGDAGTGRVLRASAKYVAHRSGPCPSGLMSTTAFGSPAPVETEDAVAKARGCAKPGKRMQSVRLQRLSWRRKQQRRRRRPSASLRRRPGQASAEARRLAEVKAKRLAAEEAKRLKQADNLAKHGGRLEELARRCRK